MEQKKRVLLLALTSLALLNGAAASPTEGGICDIKGGFLYLGDSEIRQGEETQARITAYNEGDAQEVRAIFKVGGVTVSSSQSVVEGPSTFTASISPDSDSTVTAVLETVGGPCGDQEITRSSERISVDVPRRDGGITTVVEGSTGEPLEDARVVLERDERRNVVRTDSDGRALFRGEPGRYEVTASKSRFSSDSARITLDEAERETVRLTLRSRNREASLNVVAEDSRGDRLEDVEIEVRNGETLTRLTDASGRTSFDLEQGSFDITASRSGYQIEQRSISLDSGEERTLTLELSRIVDEPEQDARLDVEAEDSFGDALEDARVRVRNGDSETEFTDFRGDASFSLEPGTYDVRVSKGGFLSETSTVELEEGDIRRLSFELDRTSGDDEASLDVIVEEEDGDRIPGATVRARNGESKTGSTDSNGVAEFSLQPGSYDVRASDPEYFTETRSVDLEEDESRTLRFNLQRRESRGDREASLDVEVVDGDSDPVRDARVRVENGEDTAEFTDSDGDAEFSLEPDRYTVTASLEDYGTDSRTITLFDGDRRSIDLRLDTDAAERRLSFEGLGYSNTACRNENYTVTVNVRNTGPGTSAELRISGLGDSDSEDVFIGRDEVTTESLTIENVRGSGAESFTVTADNGELRTASRTVRVESCDGDDGDSGDDPLQDAASISVDTDPSEINLGESTRISGYVNGVEGRTDVDVFIAGSKAADVSTQPDGYFQTFVQPQQVGRLGVRAESGGEEAINEVNVLPGVAVTSISAPERVFEGEQFELCSDVESAVDARVTLSENGESIATERGSGEICFDVESSEGTKTYTVRGFAGGNSDSLSREIEVLPLDNEVENFPDKLATVRTGDGIVRVSLYNTGDSERRYELEMEGIPEDWFSQTSKSVILSKGERREVYFYVTPEAEGEFEADISVSSSGNDIYQQEITISSGGTTKSTKGILDRLVALFAL